MVESATCQDNVVATQAASATSCCCCCCDAALTDAHATMALDIGHCTSHTWHIWLGQRGTHWTWRTQDRTQHGKAVTIRFAWWRNATGGTGTTNCWTRRRYGSLPSTCSPFSLSLCLSDGRDGGNHVTKCWPTGRLVVWQLEALHFLLDT